jgi:hypothetical protein
MTARPKYNGYTPEKPMHLTARCQRNGCGLHALRVPKLMIPVRGLGHLVEPFEVLIEHELCVAHREALNPQDYLTKLVRGAAKHIMRAAGVEPDFAAAYFDDIHIMSEEYRRHQKVKFGDADANDVRLLDSQRGLG